MASKSGTTDVKTIVHKDHEVITPPDTLRKQAVVMARPESVANYEAQAIQAANKSLEALSSHFAEWIVAEIAALETVSAAYYTKLDAETLDSFYRKAHDIRGHATTLGFPEAAAIAEGLCLIIEKIQPLEGATFELVQAHVDALRAGVHHQIAQDDNGKVLKALAMELAVARQTKFGSKLDPV